MIKLEHNNEKINEIKNLNIKNIIIHLILIKKININ